jgi:hypothetical protein
VTRPSNPRRQHANRNLKAISVSGKTYERLRAYAHPRGESIASVVDGVIRLCLERQGA